MTKNAYFEIFMYNKRANYLGQGDFFLELLVTCQFLPQNEFICLDFGYLILNGIMRFRDLKKIIE